VVGNAIFRRVMIRPEPLSLMASYIKIKRVKLAQSHIAITVKGNWTLKE